MNGFIKALSFIFSFIIGFITFPVSFLPSELNDNFQIIKGEYSESSITFNGENINVTTEGNVFFNENKTVSFSGPIKINFDDTLADWFNYYGISYTSDAYIKGKLNYRTGVKEKSEATFSLLGFSVFNRAVPDREIYIENENYKLGIDLLWGGALSYLEDKNSDVEAVKVNNTVKVDSKASLRYNTESISSNVNLINRYDTGRLVQQSYYGTASGGY